MYSEVCSPLSVRYGAVKMTLIVTNIALLPAEMSAVLEVDIRSIHICRALLAYSFLALVKHEAFKSDGDGGMREVGGGGGRGR